MRTHTLLNIATLSFFALGAGSVAHADDLKTTIAAADSAWSAAYATGDAKAVAVLYTADGQILAEGSEPV